MHALHANPSQSIRHSLLGEIKVPVFHDVEQAAQRIRDHVRRTPLLRSPVLDEIAGARVWLKAENLQITGSFKARGAFNALLSMSPDQRSRGVIAYSTGNHGQAIAWAAKQLNTKATIVMPSDAPKNKILGALKQGAEVRQYDRRHESREAIGMQILEETGGTLIPPGDHPDVLAGQGTVILEAIADLQRETEEGLDNFITPCGGGGLAAGSSLVLKALSPSTGIFAVEPGDFDDTVRSLASGRRESNPAGSQSICDALQAVTPAELPYEINRHALTGAVAVSDEEVAAAIRFALEQLHVLVEPGGCVALAAVLAGKLALNGGNTVLVLSGGNIDMPLLETMLR
ncbi:threonine/serine dehydratase [Herbaspirillum rhizosphaerae]|uniref:Threonine/serine dehydratase n=1 Tax=Herbaspirillum rhizosphaerae TaxID=346179 RepID=A0ABW8Z3W5_9BURK